MPAVKTYLRLEEQQRFAQQFFAQLSERGISKTKAAELLGRSGTATINEYLAGTPMAPDTVRQLCEAAGIRWPTIFANAGFYEELLFMLADLAWLGEVWCEEDRVYPWCERRESFRTAGVLKVDDKIVSELYEDERFKQRYHVGFWETEESVWDEQELDRARAQTPIGQPFQVEPIGTRRVRKPTILPKPMAIALFITVSGFPRRGDYFKDGADAFGANLLVASASLIDFARQQRESRVGRRKPEDLPELLRRACKVLDDESIDFGTRRINAAEYVANWADLVCNDYHHYARLAAFEFWGEAGSSATAPTAFGILPQLRRAAMPTLDEFATQQSGG